ncbi:hypothetical protein, variant 1 [Blastomyces gilchristii SLH14081]|uniref:Uncharacterized protein n=3 Tax=Blastomyces TaxID=229219 RepID=A0A179UWW7_BLAGS|nr:uncharacterized protein BDBG_07705 [Blastomyces gilchristii SLH14081]XP_031580333.1 hypothetical protein, variant 1 [Blastomyces gilchristii SLH14081]EGE83598.1 hypothetical protein BDDG_06542 [Blastomyces dermatitidis ATCC 18188]EQL34647.1 hypothetical protein BDFG_03596 [Blastomyces dermatitidis ATCC 26199]EQL34648.1 hypothetical protein, variant 1 [Blastomyces dermatitidis ATCC 26199]KMW68150.1 hypothetical protein, variant [Blastomyces dermatitidis ATCC 18188]OAT12349.1 hypothetical pr
MEDGRDSLDEECPNLGDDELNLKFISTTTVSSHHLRKSSAPSFKLLLGSPSTDDLPFGYKLRRFWPRAVIGVVVPPVVTAYYTFLVLYYLKPQDEDTNPLRVGPGGANFAFWSWFLIGVFGLNLSKYGLIGTEAGMLMYNRSLGPRNALQLMMHADRTWSGPSGWLKILRKSLFLWKADGRSSQNTRGHAPSRLWFVLLFLSALPLVALPISGLCMESGDGYIFRKSGPSNQVVLGRNQANFDLRELFSIYGKATNDWKTGAPVRLPGIGVMYTRPGLKRSEYDFLQRFPNTFPPDSGVPEIFLAPQAPTPVLGTTSGLLIRYNCSSASKISDFTILNRFHERGNYSMPKYDSETNIVTPNFHYRKIGQDQVTLANYRTPNIENYEAVMEFGFPSYPAIRYQSTNTSERRWGIEKDFLSEYILYQYLDLPGPKSANKSSVNKFDESLHGQVSMEVDEPIPDVAEKYHLEHHSTGGSNSTNTMKVAIGIRCTSASDFGIADVDGMSNTFTNFKPHDVIPAVGTILGAPPFGPGAVRALIFKLAEYDRALGSIGPQNVLSSVEGPGYIDPGNRRKVIAPSYIQSTQLRNSVLQAHAAFALELAYDGVAKYDNLSQYLRYSNGSSEAPSSEYHSRSFFTHENFTTTTPGKVLTRGPLKNIWIPLYLLVPWTIGSVFLALIYSHKPRWSETFDGYSLFRFGADFADQVKGRREFVSTEDYEMCGALRDLPGFIGDSRPLFTPGHISLVKNSMAAPDKLYM